MPSNATAAAPAEAHPLIDARGVSQVFPGGVTALADLDISVNRGEFVAIVGPSGCGKSTFLRQVAGLETPTGGALTVGRQTPLLARRQNQDTAYVFQDATLLPWRTVEQNVALPLQLRPDGKGTLSVDEALDLVGLRPFAGAYPNQLSGGMRMRVSIARALVSRPGLLLMDEPFGALDEMTRQRLNEELLRLWERDHWTCLFVTHNVAEAVFLSQRVLVMSPRPGRILAEFPVDIGVERTPQLRTSAAFNKLVGTVTRHLHHDEAP